MVNTGGQVCPNCTEKNNPSFSKCWKCGFMFSGGYIDPTLRPEDKTIVVGFWKRFFADILDSIFLGLFGFALTVPFREFFYRFGEDGVWLGLVVTFLYTGILQSSIGKGQSLAKKMLGIEVLRLDGTYMSLFQSFLRYAVLALLVYNGGIYMGLKSIFPFLGQPLGIALFFSGVIVLFTGCAVLLPMHPLKRGVQDLVAGSVVVRKGRYDAEKIAALNNPSKVKRAYIFWIVTAVLLSVFNIAMLTRQTAWSELTRLTDLVNERTELRNAGVGINIQFGTAERPKQKTLTVNGFLSKDRFDQPRTRDLIFAKTAKLLAENHRDKDLDFIFIQIRTGYSIGIANLTFHDRKTYTAAGDPVIYPEAVEPID